MDCSPLRCQGYLKTQVRLDHEIGSYGSRHVMNEIIHTSCWCAIYLVAMAVFEVHYVKPHPPDCVRAWIRWHCRICGFALHSPHQALTPSDRRRFAAGALASLYQLVIQAVHALCEDVAFPELFGPFRDVLSQVTRSSS